MGIFDVFKTKVSEAADKAGDVAGQAKDKVSGLMDKDGGKGGKQDGESATHDGARGPLVEATAEGEASNMVSEGAPVSHEGEATPGAGDDGAPAAAGGSSGGMTQTIKDNAGSGADKVGELAKKATGGKFDDKIDSGVKKAKDMLG